MQGLTNIPHLMRLVLIERLRHQHPGSLRIHRRLATQTAPRPGGRQPGPCPFLNQPPFKLRQYRNWESIVLWANLAENG